MGHELAMSVIERHQRRRRGHARRITIDLDPTDDATHGAQQLTFFNKYYDSWCYLPLLAFLTFDDEAEQYLCAAVLRPGNVPATRGAVGVLRRLLALLRLAFPQARFLVRLDGGFATPEIFDVLDAEPGLDYVVAMAKNAVLVRDAEPAMAVAHVQSEASGQTEHVYTDVQYAAGTWVQARRVVIKAEVVQLAGRAPQDNPRFVVTNLRQTPRFIYERIYCARGDIENRIKELHDGLQIGRTSCWRFWANQLRVFLTAAASVLMQELRLRATGTACARAQVTWLRDRLLKLGAHVVASVRRIVLHLPTATPDLHAWRHIALALGARPRLARTFAPPSGVTGLRETAPGGAVLCRSLARAIRPIFRPTWPALDRGNVRSFVRDTITPFWEPKSDPSRIIRAKWFRPSVCLPERHHETVEGNSQGSGGRPEEEDGGEHKGLGNRDRCGYRWQPKSSRTTDECQSGQNEPLRAHWIYLQFVHGECNRARAEAKGRKDVQFSCTRDPHCTHPPRVCVARVS